MNATAHETEKARRRARVRAGSRRWIAEERAARKRERKLALLAHPEADWRVTDELREMEDAA